MTRRTTARWAFLLLLSLVWLSSCGVNPEANNIMWSNQQLNSTVNECIQYNTESDVSDSVLLEQVTIYCRCLYLRAGSEWSYAQYMTNPIQYDMQLDSQVGPACRQQARAIAGP